MRSCGLGPLAILLCPHVVLAGADVPPDFLAGRYLLVGKISGDVLSDDIWITTAEDGLSLVGCALGAGGLNRDAGPEGIPFHSGRFAGGTLGCEVFVDMGNYAIFACWGEAGDRLALFPDAERFGTKPDCRQ